MFGIGYYGFSYVAGLSPIYGFNSVDAANGWQQYPDTIDPRQKDQTHTALVALNDVWKLGENQELQLSGFFRTYNLSLFSDFGDGLIRQSEFRTVTGGSAAYKKKFSKKFTLLAGTDYEREAPRRDDLDHYNFFNPAAPYYYGPFIKVDGNNVTIAPLSPYIAGGGRAEPVFPLLPGLATRRDQHQQPGPGDSGEFLEQAGGAEFSESDDHVLSEGILVGSRRSRSALGSHSSRKIPERDRLRDSRPRPAHLRPLIRWRRHGRISWWRASASTTRI